jgi:hypothetical protein
MRILFRRFERKRTRPVAMSWVSRPGENRTRSPDKNAAGPQTSAKGAHPALAAATSSRPSALTVAADPLRDLHCLHSIPQPIEFARRYATFKSVHCLISSTCETPDPRGIHRTDPPPRLLVDGCRTAVGSFAIADLSDRRRRATSSALGLFPLGPASPARNGPRRSAALAPASRVAPQAFAGELQQTPAGGCLANRRSRRRLGRARLSRRPSSGTLRRNCSSRDPPRRAVSHPAQIRGDGIRRSLSAVLSPTTRLFSLSHGPQCAPAKAGSPRLTAAPSQRPLEPEQRPST